MSVLSDETGPGGGDKSRRVPTIRGSILFLLLSLLFASDFVRFGPVPTNRRRIGPLRHRRWFADSHRRRCQKRHRAAVALALALGFSSRFRPAKIATCSPLRATKSASNWPGPTASTSRGRKWSATPSWKTFATSPSPVSEAHLEGQQGLIVTLKSLM